MVTPNRWELVLEAKPRPIIEHLLDEAAKLFAADLSRWPPALEELDLRTGASVAALLADTPVKPDERVYREAFRLTRLDLGRELEAYEDYLHNQRWQEAGLAAKDRPMVLFLSRYMAEQLFALGEATEGRVDRPRMLEVLARTEAQLLRGAPRS